MLSLGAGPLYRVLQQMGKTLEKQKAEIGPNPHTTLSQARVSNLIAFQLCRVSPYFPNYQSARPSWMDDLLEKVERAGQLNEKFTELVQITSDILRIAEDSPEGARLEAQVKKLGDKASQPAVMHPVVEAKMEELESSLTELKKRIALTPSVTEIAQLRELVVDRSHSEPVFAFGPTYPNFACSYTSIRCKKLKVQLSDKQLTTEKTYDLKMGAHLNRLHEWESKIGSTVRDRFLVLEDNWETTGKDMDVFRNKFDDGLRRMDREMDVLTSKLFPSKVI